MYPLTVKVTLSFHLDAKAATAVVGFFLILLGL